MRCVACNAAVEYGQDLCVKCKAVVDDYNHDLVDMEQDEVFLDDNGEIIIP